MTGATREPDKIASNTEIMERDTQYIISYQACQLRPI